MVRTFDSPLNTNDQSIDRVLNAGLPVVLIFLDGSTSNELDAVLNRLAREQAGKLLVVKAPLKDSQQAAARFGLTHTPAVVTARGGQTQSLAQGISASELEKHAAYLLGNGPKPEAPTQTATQGTGGGRPLVVTDASFAKEVLGSSQPVLVDFWAPWCGPCRMVAPIVERLAEEFAGRMKVAKVNVDENPHISQNLRVQSIPTMIVVKNGQVVDRWVGAQPENAIRGHIAPFVR